jgi:inositol 1,4,5-triphosphate receptor type 1
MGLGKRGACAGGQGGVSDPGVWVPGKGRRLNGSASPGGNCNHATHRLTVPSQTLTPHLPPSSPPHPSSIVISFPQVCASPDVTSFKVIPFSVNERAWPSMKDRLCGLSAVAVQDLVANTVYINFLGAINDKFLYFQSPLARADPNAISGTDCWRMELVVEGVRPWERQAPGRSEGGRNE